MLQPIYTKRFMEIATIYVKEGIVIKIRPGYEGRDIEQLKEERVGVIEEIQGKLYCYFREEQRFLVEHTIKEMNTILKRNDFNKYIIYK